VRLSVVIPVRDDPRLAACLGALAGQSLGRDAFEIIVVDDGGDVDATRALADRHGARHAHQPPRGSYAARELGAGLARGAVLAFTDADCRPDAAWLDTIDQLFGDPACQVVIGPSTSAGSSTVALWAQGIDDARWAALRRVDRPAFCDTRNLALRREVLDAVGFDTSFRQAGDLDLGLRLHAAGYRIVMEPAMRVAHDNPTSLRTLLRRGVRRGRGLARLERKHGRIAAPIGQRPVRLGRRDVKRAILGVARHRLVRWIAIPIASAVLGTLVGVLWLLARLPGGRAAGQGLFVVFERLSLLLGRLLG